MGLDGRCLHKRDREREVSAPRGLQRGLRLTRGTPCPQKHERQAQHQFQQQQRRKREEEERQRHAEYHARKEREGSRTDGAKADLPGQEPGPEKSQAKGKGPGHGSEKPKRPSSLLATNNVMKLKQIIPLQGKFLSGGGGPGPGGARSPQSPTSTDNKLPGFLSFKFLKSPETKREANAEKAPSSPTKTFNPGKLFNFSKSDAGGNGGGAAPLLPPTARPGPAADLGERAAPPSGRSHLNGVADEEGLEEPEIQTVLDDEAGGHKL